MNDKRRALVTGAAGQDGYYLSELLQAEGMEFFGLIRRHADGKRDAALGTIAIEGDITDLHRLREIFNRARPHEVYNLAAQSHAGLSFQTTLYTMQVNAIGAINVLNLSREFGSAFYQASTSE